VKKTFDRAFRKAANSRKARLAVLVTTMVVLGIAISTGAAALATDTTQTTSNDTTSSDKTTSNHTTSTSTGTTSTVTTTSTGTTTVSVAPITGAGGQAGAVGGGQGGGGEVTPAGEAAQAAAGESQLAFTGVHVPALILIALGMIAAGIVLRRKLEDAA
jgi:hypothetical protein